MLVEVEDVLNLAEYQGADPDEVKRKILGIESAIRAYTNNDFTVRGARFYAPTLDGKLVGNSPYIKAGDRVQIVSSGFLDGDRLFVPNGMNNGLYDVLSVSEGITEVDGDLFTMDFNDVMLVRYPAAITSGVMDLLKWEAKGRENVGVASESISRHSVSYYQFSDSEMLMGYPAALMGFLKPYMKARF